MSKLIIIRGNSGSGKSTVAKRLRYALGHETMLVPQDIVRREIIRTPDTLGNPSIQLIRDIAIYGRNIGYSVVVEGILHRQKYGKMLRELVALFDEVYVYYFDISFDETLRRHHTKSNSHEFGEAEMREWYVGGDTLGLPGEKIFTDEWSEDAVFETIFYDVQHK